MEETPDIELFLLTVLFQSRCAHRQAGCALVMAVICWLQGSRFSFSGSPVAEVCVSCEVVGQICMAVCK